MHGQRFNLIGSSSGPTLNNGKEKKKEKQKLEYKDRTEVKGLFGLSVLGYIAII